MSDYVLLASMDSDYDKDKSYDRRYSICSAGSEAAKYRNLTGDSSENYRYESITSLISGDRIAQKIINTPVYDSISNWRDTSSEEIDSIDSRLTASVKFQEAARIYRTYGKSLIFPVIVDARGKMVKTSIPLDRINQNGLEVRTLEVIRDEIIVSDELDQDVNSNTYGMPELIKVGERDFHPSRCILFNNDKGLKSYFDSIRQDLANYHESKHSLQHGVRRSTGIVLSVNAEGLVQKLADEQMATGSSSMTIEGALKKYARIFYDNLDNHNVAIIDSRDKVEFFQKSNISQLVQNVESNMLVLSAVSEQPFSMLFGKSESGLNTSNNSSFENYSQSLERFRSQVIDPRLAHYDSMLKSIYNIDYTTSWNPTKVEELRLQLNGNETIGEEDAV